MATATARSRCATCGKEKAILKCGGCTQDFCYDHFGDHRQQLNTQLEEVEVYRDLFRQTLSEHTAAPQTHPLMQQIDEWERDSIHKIRQTAQEAKQLLLQHTTKYVKQVEVKLNKLTDQLRQGREENDFVETDLRHWHDQLTQLSNELNKPSNIALRHDSKQLVTKLCVDITTEPLYISKTGGSLKWVQNGITVAGGNGEGNGLNQMAWPLGIYIDDDQTIYVADQENDRIVEWKRGTKSGKVVAGRNGKGNRADQFNLVTDVVLDKKTNSLIICDLGNRRVVQWPLHNGVSGQTIISVINCKRLTMDNDGYLYISDGEKHEVRRWKIGDTSGTVVAGGNGQGNRLDQLNSPAFIFVDNDYSVYVSDLRNHRVMKWLKHAREGIVVAGGQGEGSGLTQLSGPQGVIVDEMGNVYVADWSNHRVMRWCKGAKEGNIVLGGKDAGDEPNQLKEPQGLSFDREGNLYVVDQGNNRVQKFNIKLNSSS